MNMNKGLLIVVVLLLAGGAWWMSRPKSGVAETKPLETSEMEKKNATAGENAVELKDFAFNPKTITVKAGSTVTVTNADLTGHSVTADDASFDSGVLSQGESATVTFDKAGTFGFHCTPHPNMKLTVVVE